MRFRGKSIRRKIVVLLLVPLVSLVAIWGFASYLTAQDARQLLRVADVAEKVGYPAADTAEAVQRERRQVLVYLADPRRSGSLTRLHREQRGTDRQVASFRTHATSGDLRSDLGSESKARLDELLGALAGLEKLRSSVEENTITRGGAFQAYNEIVDPGYSFLATLSALNDPALEKQGRALVGLTQAREYLSREDALMAAALTAGKMTRGDQRAFSDRVAERDATYRTNLQPLPAEQSQTFENYWNGTDGRTLRSYEDAIIAAGPRAAAGSVTPQRWESAAGTVLDDLARMGKEADERYEDRVAPEATKVLLRAGGAVLLGLVALLASLIVSFRVGRTLVRDLGALRKEANESAGVRLPSVMRRLGAGEQVDVETEAPRLQYPPDEMGQVGQALNTLQRAAVEAAVKQSDMRRGVSEVFVNLARRNQVLLHRQLTLLDTMERRTEDTDELADLFKLDHLTTRMRRHAEGLVILSGAAPSRQWRKPIQLMDVVRAAVAEVEDYERIEVRRLPKLAVDGSAVADLTHLIAEMLENATVFSPPHTAVQVLGERVANGFTLEVHDRGLGMAQEALLDANLRLAETPEFELSDTDRLGLFVVSRLAQRQGVRVSLQHSPYGGTTAVILIPGAILTETPGHQDEHRASLEREDAPRGGPAAGLLEAGTAREVLDGPVELEARLDELDDPDTGGRLFRHRGDPTPRREAVPAGEQHQQAHDESPRDGGGEPSRPVRTGPSASPPAAGAARDETGDGKAPLPRRRKSTPVLVADHGRTVDEARRTRAPRTDEEADEARDPEGGAQARPAEPEPAALRDEHLPGPRGGTATGPGGLPRRVRQANLAPQLKREPTPEPDDSPAQSVDDRDAEEVRGRMAALQRGWQRGRAQAPESSSDGTGEGTPGTKGDGR